MQWNVLCNIDGTPDMLEGNFIQTVHIAFLFWCTGENAHDHKEDGELTKFNDSSYELFFVIYRRHCSNR